MELQHVAQPVSQIPIGPRLYPVATLSLEDIRRLMPLVKTIAENSMKPVTGDLALAYVVNVRALVEGDHPELTDDYVTSWLSPALCTMAALEFQRQYFGLVRFARA